MNVLRTRHASIVGAAWLAALSAVCATSPLMAQDLTSPRDLDPEVRMELRYANGLTALGMPDYAEIVLDRLEGRQGGPMYKVIKLRGLISMGRFEDVRRIIGREPDQDSEAVWAMKMALADGYYAWGRYDEAQGIYNMLFKAYPNGPPEALNEFYVNSAYKCAQMLILMGRLDAAVEAYENVFKGKVEEHVKRQVLTETAEVLVRLAEKAPPEKRARYIDKIENITNEILWVQDLWFGKAIVILAHVKLIEGDVDGAMRLVDDYWEQLKTVDASLRRQARESGEDLTRLSPLVECRYLLGVMMQNEAERLLAAGGDRDTIVTLLAGREIKRGPKTTRSTGALQHFLNVFIRYPDTTWAPDAGARAARVEELLKQEFGAKIKKHVTSEQMAKVMHFQFQNALALYNQQRFDEAAEAYLKVLNLFPEASPAVNALGNLARCYIELASEIHADTIMHHLAERFCRHPSLMTRAGDEVLRLAALFQEREVPEKRDQLYNLFFRYYGHHARAPYIYQRLGDEAFNADDFERAADYYRKIADRYADSPLYPEALNKMAVCFSKLEKPLDAAKVLTSYIEALETREKPGSAAVQARYRLAYAFKQAGGKYLPSAANRYTELVKLLRGDRSRYQANEEEAEANARILQGALFYKAACFAALKKPQDKLKTYRMYAIKVFNELVEEFPSSDFAPAALSQAGTLWTILGNPEQAQRVLRRLQKQYPDSEEARNALFMLGSSLLDLGMRRHATEIFKEMFEGAGNYTPRQILAAATALHEAGEHVIALQAFERVLVAEPERPVDERARLGKGRLLIDMERFADGAAVLEAMLETYPKSGYTVNASYSLSRAYAAMGSREAEADKRVDLFNEAIKAMKRVRRFETSPGGRARSDVELGKILELKAEAEEEFGSEAKARDYTEAAIATYQTLTLLGDIDHPDVRPHIEEAYAQCMPLLLDIERWQDVLDDCDRYLEFFPRGRYVVQVRNWRNRAKVRMATQTPAPTGTTETDKTTE